MVGETTNVEVEDTTVDIKATGVIEGAEAVNQWAEFEVEVHPNHPRYLNLSHNPGMSPTSIKLTGPENYPTWSRDMIVTL